MSRLIFVIGVAAVFAIGCSSTEDVSVNNGWKTTEVKKVDLSKPNNIDLPTNYDVSAFSKVDIATYVARFSWQGDAQKAEIDTSIIASLLENEVARTKRFNVLSRTCLSCPYEYVYQLENGSDYGAMDAGEQGNPEYLLEASVEVGSIIKELYDRNEIIFRSMITSKLINPNTNEIIHAFEPIRHNSEPKTYFVVGGKHLGGFNLHDAKEISQAYEETIQQSTAILVKKVMEYYPAGGRVLNYRLGRMSVDTGILYGFADKQEVVLFLRDDGIDFPIASAIVTPSQQTGSGQVLTWRQDEMAKSVRAKLEKEGKMYLQSHQLYAVSMGAPDA